MDILKLAAEMFMKNSSTSGLSTDAVMNGLKGLLADDSGNLDLQGLVGKFGSSGLGALVSSWLGDGSNMSLSADQVTEVLGKDKVEGFASSLGMDSQSASNGLASMLPQLMDQSSTGGSLLSSENLGKALGGLSSLGGLFK